ncbi:AprI/Inh family metalloprotease inhibitor [Methylobacterium sp. C25]|uniref:AprI/Inh family metalloprotease inhibitor n=1 Tax=Methylobacterium sp. C25 TaxID=2721622 RepID=UPI001F301A40|nr:AprI/Inh family metalloprotease inhibitor [Methylobacterium sp. C25]MCE4225726.1 AprI/Inh family metalloprotease inhibitor [Methylobacterium sp. C25]
MIRGALAGCALLIAVDAPARAQDAAPRMDEMPAPPGATAPPPPGPVMKTLPETLGDAVGTWDMSLDGGNRRCELSLSGDSGPNGRVLRFPAGCRRALPVLAEAAGWLFAEKGIRIVDRNVRPLVSFVPRPDQQSLAGKDEKGGSYSLVPLQTMATLPPPPPPIAEESPPSSSGLPDVAPTQGIPGSQPVLQSGVLTRPQAAAPVETPAPLRPVPTGSPSVGTYALDRFNEKDVCRIALESRTIAAKAEREPLKDLSPARLLPGCRDSGIATFDPTSWRYAAGHLTLKARRGHAINLVRTADGAWRRDPDTGTTLILRKVEN